MLIEVIIRPIGWMDLSIARGLVSFAYLTPDARAEGMGKSERIGWMCMMMSSAFFGVKPQEGCCAACTEERLSSFRNLPANFYNFVIF